MGKPQGQLKVILGAALLRKVRKMAAEDVRPITYQIAWLCRLAFQTPKQPERAPSWDLGDDPARSGLASMAIGVVPDVFAKILDRIEKTKESKSQAVRQLVRAGIALEEWRKDVMREGTKKEKG